MTIVDMQAEEVCLHPRSFWLQIPSGGVVHAIRVKLLSLGQMVKVLNSCSSVTPNYMASKSPAFNVLKRPSIAGAKPETTETVSKPESAFVDEQIDQICCTNTKCQSPSNSIMFKHSENHTNEVQHICIYSCGTSFLIFLLEDGAQSCSLAAPARH